mgnify:FL=1
MTLENLGMEYLKEADRLKARLCELNLLLKRERDEEQKLLLKRRIYYLYTEMRDTEQTAEYLLNYYSAEQSDQGGEQRNFDIYGRSEEYEKNNIA